MLFRMLFVVLLNPPLLITMITLLHAIHQVELPSSGACILIRISSCLILNVAVVMLNLISELTLLS